MRARPEVRRILIAKKLQRYALIGRNPSAFPNYSASRTKRNYARLFARNEAMVKRHLLGSFEDEAIEHVEALMEKIDERWPEEGKTATGWLPGTNSP